MYREYCRTPQDRRGNMVEESILKGRQGYTSVFSFEENDAFDIQEAGHSRGLKQYAVSAKYLIMDFDDGMGSAEKVSNILTDRRVSHWVFSSGGKGAHVYAKCIEVYSVDLPDRHRNLALSLSPACDTSIYRHNSLIRLPGTIHERTGNRKELISVFEGSQELVPIASAEPIIFASLPVSNQDSLYFMFLQMAHAADQEVSAGHRHEVLWRVVADCYRAGLSFPTTVELCLIINAQFKPPKDENIVRAVVEARYK